jgi:hypothetical protein
MPVAKSFTSTPFCPAQPAESRRQPTERNKHDKHYSTSALTGQSLTALFPFASHSDEWGASDHLSHDRQGTGPESAPSQRASAAPASSLRNFD